MSSVGVGVVAVHGGAWDIPEPLWPDTISGVKTAARIAYKVKTLHGCGYICPSSSCAS